VVIIFGVPEKHEDSIGNFSMWSVVRVGACQLCGRLATTGLCM
jgi:hypothetical protein